MLILPVAAFSDVQTSIQTLAADISPYGRISVPATVDFRSNSTRFGALTASISVNYKARTSAGSSASIGVQASSEFSPAGGPVVSAVTFTCSSATLGAPCSGSQNLSTSTQSPVVSISGASCTGGGGACSEQDSNTVLLNLTLPSKPSYRTGTYATQVTLTISTM
jgi:hypothetical protein